MATEGRKQRESRAGRWRRRRKSVYASVVKAGVRKYAGKSPRKPGRRCHSLAWEKQNQADALPAGAMAPRNTTQYLMELVYSDMNITAPSSRHTPGLRERVLPQRALNRRHFDGRHFDGRHLGAEKKGKENPETEPLNPFKTKRRACAAGGSWLCVMCRCPECCKPRPRLLRHLSTQVNLLHKERRSEAHEAERLPVFRPGWKETGEPGRNPHGHRENM
ncbi:hypothetical protein PGIGA_G00089580 [Pangasianodon gigas]|uniref:Uncharacterized protein n=1 Tax=Pangasianodon gigas TaxID=30993 RepID=A0ACC5XCS2_PANGG|nr:hypothetical protein [Pangasianodon gigas]